MKSEDHNSRDFEIRQGRTLGVFVQTVLRNRKQRSVTTKCLAESRIVEEVADSGGIGELRATAESKRRDALTFGTQEEELICLRSRVHAREAATTRLGNELKGDDGRLTAANGYSGSDEQHTFTQDWPGLKV